MKTAMNEKSDLECLDAMAEYVRRVGRYGADEALSMGPRCDVGRAVALVDAALVRGLRTWWELADFGGEGLILEHGRIAAKVLPRVQREARRRLGR